MARPVSGNQRLGDCRGMGRMVAKTSGSLRFRLGLRLAPAITCNARAPSVRLAHCDAGCELGLYRPPTAENRERTVSATRLDNHLPVLRPSIDRDDANGCVPVLLRMHGLRHSSQAEGRGLLRLLLLRRRAVPADSGGRRAWSRCRMLLGRIEQRPNFLRRHKPFGQVHFS